MNDGRRQVETNSKGPESKMFKRLSPTSHFS